MSQESTTRRTFIRLAALCGAGFRSDNEHRVTSQSNGKKSAPSSYLDILRCPDLLIAYSGLNTRMRLARSGDRWSQHDVLVQTKVIPGITTSELSIRLNSPRTLLTHLHLRWNLRVVAGLRILGDAWERSYGDLEWRGFVPERPMPWYFLTFDGNQLNGYGVRTGARSFCFWQLDPGGISLWIDVRNGGNPIELGSRQLYAATVVTRQAQESEAPIESARFFCRAMCPEPRLPDG